MISKPNAKAKAAVRFQQVNLLIDEVLRHMPHQTTALVLIVCWRHADRRGIFRVRASVIGESVRLSKRQVQGHLRTLRAIGAIKQTKPAGGTMPPEYQITGHPRC
jgi:hypothetical protein